MGIAAGWPVACGCRQELKLEPWEPWESLSGFVGPGLQGQLALWVSGMVTLQFCCAGCIERSHSSLHFLFCDPHSTVVPAPQLALT